MTEDALEQPVALLSGVVKGYRLDDVDVPVLKDIDLLVRPAQFTVVLGPSGSGKTTLLNLIGCIDRPDQGQVMVAGQDIGRMSDDELAAFRARHIGFIFQNFNLLPVLSAWENIEYPMLLARLPADKRAERVTRLLKAVGLTDRATNRPGQLSGGQRQRVAIARALALKPRLVIADEPTANLDSRTGAEILQLMRRMQRHHGVSFIFSSHDRAVIGAADDTIYLKDGQIRGIRRRTPAAPREASADGMQADSRPPGVDGADDPEHEGRQP
uniref:ABC transporter, ATP-binding protein n=1 Tax=Rubrivivax gelatinosus S1 TaxID=1138313 RepID=L8BAQ8_RUBGE|nr:ABC transporter, ATP-binding protein [Rubrivivax gelatinosus S1]